MHPPARPRRATPVRAAQDVLLVDPFAGEIASMLDRDPKVPATVVIQHLRRSGYAGGITILKEHLSGARPSFLAARTFQRTSYLPGEVSQIDWWHTGRKVPVGKGASREAFGLVATLPHSAAHAAVFTFGRTVADLLQAALGCFERLGGAPEKVVCDNDAAIVAERRGGVAILHDEVAAFFGLLGTRVVVLRPGDPQAKGQVERTNGYLDRSFLSLRDFALRPSPPGPGSPGPPRSAGASGEQARGCRALRGSRAAFLSRTPSRAGRNPRSGGSADRRSKIVVAWSPPLEALSHASTVPVNGSISLPASRRGP